MPGSDGEDDGVAPEQQHEDDDEDLRGRQIWLLDPSLVQRWKNSGLVAHFQDDSLLTLNLQNNLPLKITTKLKLKNIIFIVQSNLFKRVGFIHFLFVLF